MPNDFTNTEGFRNANKLNKACCDVIKKCLMKQGLRCLIPSNNTSKVDVCNLCTMGQGGAYTRYTVRADKWIGTTGNLYLEIKLTRINGQTQVASYEKGWFLQAKTDKLIYVDVSQNKYYIYDMKALRRFVSENENNPELVGRKTDIDKVDKKTTVETYIVNRRVLQKHGLEEVASDIPLEFLP